MTSDSNAPPEPRSLTTSNGRRKDQFRTNPSNIKRRKHRSQRRRCRGAANRTCPHAATRGPRLAGRGGAGLAGPTTPGVVVRAQAGTVARPKDKGEPDSDRSTVISPSRVRRNKALGGEELGAGRQIMPCLRSTRPSVRASNLKGSFMTPTGPLPDNPPADALLAVTATSLEPCDLPEREVMLVRSAALAG